MMGEERRNSFMTEVLSYRNQSIGFYTTGTAVMKELILCYLYVFIKIYYLIMDQNNQHQCVQIFKENAFSYPLVKTKLIKRLTLE